MSSEPVNSEALTDHSYDGIQEYDNPLPGWWKWLFVATVFFAPLYWAYFQLGPEDRSIFGQYDRDMAAKFELRFSEIGELQPDQETIVKYMNEDKWLKVGEVTYKTNCVSCHGADGGGVVGPNLTDEYWKNLRSIDGIAKVISEGAANGAMPAWKHRLKPTNRLVLTAAYVASLQKNPVSGRPPEGNKVEPWASLVGRPQTPAAEDTKSKPAASDSPTTESTSTNLPGK